MTERLTKKQLRNIIVEAANADSYFMENEFMDVMIDAMHKEIQRMKYKELEACALRAKNSKGYRG